MASNKVFFGIVLSVLLHLTLGFGARAFFVPRPMSTVIAELDLSMASSLPVRAERPIKPNILRATWMVPKTGVAPIPSVVPEPTLPSPSVENACPAPCDRDAVSANDYIPASLTKRKPRWIGNLIAEDDYPASVRALGRDGRVVAAVLIDAKGVVQDVRLLQGASETLNAVVLGKLRNAIFSPAYGTDGNPVACRVVLPIEFELKK